MCPRLPILPPVILLSMGLRQILNIVYGTEWIAAVQGTGDDSIHSRQPVRQCQGEMLFPVKIQEAESASERAPMPASADAVLDGNKRIGVLRFGCPPVAYLQKHQTKVRTFCKT